MRKSAEYRETRSEGGEKFNVNKDNINNQSPEGRRSLVPTVSRRVGSTVSSISQSLSAATVGGGSVVIPELGKSTLPARVL